MSHVHEKATIDRFEGNLAILELPDRTTITVEKDQLAGTYQEGDKLIKNQAGQWIKDEKATEEARKRIRNLLDSLMD